MPQPVTYQDVRRILNTTFEQLPDYRTGRNCQYTVGDAAWSAFGVFLTQSPSFLACQRMMQQRHGHNNAGSLFGVAAIPSDAQIRNLLDWPAPSEMSAPFWAVLECLAYQGVLAEAGYAVTRTQSARTQSARTQSARTQSARTQSARTQSART